MPTILVINDDGINSIGLSILTKQLKKLGDVIVVTPGDERSGVGKSICIGQVNVTEASFGDGTKAYATSGTPADSFLIAVNITYQLLLFLIVYPKSLIRRLERTAFR